MEGARGPCGLEKEWTGLRSNEMWREPELRPCGLEKEWTGLRSNEMWREPEDRVAWRKNGQG